MTVLLAHHQPEIEGRDLDQDSLQDVLPTSQVDSPESSRFVGVSHAALDPFNAPLRERLAALALPSTTIGVGRLLLGVFPFPATAGTLGFGDVAAQAHLREPYQG